MLYERLAQTYEEIEKVPGNLEKISLYSEMVREARSDSIDKIVALTMGELYPSWMGRPEIGIAEKMALQVIGSAASVPESDVRKALRKSGDIGSAAEILLSRSAQQTLFAEDLTVDTVFDTLAAVAEISGKGSNRDKVSKLVGLLSDASPLEAKYIIRTITGQLRMGLSVMGILDALAIAYAGGKEARPDLEHAFNFCSDLSRVARLVSKSGLNAVRNVSAEVGKPIRMMAAKKLSSPKEILEKAGPEVLAEFKYDGERVQVHKDGNTVVLFSRRQERITDQYPDIVQLVLKSVKSKTCILEGECVAIDPNTGTMRPFQELMRRRRKTDIAEMTKAVPVAIFFFDILFQNGRDLTGQPMKKRREILDRTISQGDRVALTEAELISDPDQLNAFFSKALETGHEGVMAKAIHEKSTYQAGSRSWLWIKLKASYTEGMSDSIDLVIVGAVHGRGKRTGVYGAILASAYDAVNDTYPTVCKIGTGFTDDMLRDFKERLETHRLENKNPKVISDVKADVWFEPCEVIEVLGDEITISPTHSAGRDRLKSGGLAIRFPRFTGRWRDDKDPRQATTVGELMELFETQRALKQ